MDKTHENEPIETHYYIECLERVGRSKRQEWRCHSNLTDRQQAIDDAKAGVEEYPDIACRVTEEITTVIWTYRPDDQATAAVKSK